MKIDKNNTKYRIMNVIAMLTGVMGILFIIANEAFIGFGISSPKLMTILIPSVFIMMSISVLLLNYLRSGQIFGEKRNATDELMRGELSILRKELKNSSNLMRHNERIFEEVNRLKEKILNHDRKAESLSEEEKYEIISDLKNNILNDASESFLEELEQKYSVEIRKDKYISDLRDQCQQVRERLTREIDALGRRGNLNLVIGVITTIAAIAVLSTTVLSGNHTLTSNELMAYYAPRLTLSIFIEIFSFFFLKLYKAGLGEIKYFQNELTNAELKFIAAEKAIMVDNEDSVSHVISELASTERNFKLGKGESTVDLEKFRSSQAGNQKIIESLAGLINNRK